MPHQVVSYTVKRCEIFPIRWLTGRSTPNVCKSLQNAERSRGRFTDVKVKEKCFLWRREVLFR